MLTVGNPVRPVFWAILAISIAWATLASLRRGRLAGEVLAYTECPFRGPAVVVTQSGISDADTLPVRVHEEVHAAQCRALGPVRYRIRNLTGMGKLSLEVPAYCAAAEARVRSGWTSRDARERLNDDIQAAMAEVADSTAISNALRRDCPLAS